MTSPAAATGPETVTMTKAEFDRMKTAVEAAGGLAEGMKSFQAGSVAAIAARAAESEQRMKRVEAEVFQRGQQLGRIESNLVKIADKLGLKYE